ncbi:MAG TPA: HEAT repeat domain-containing protein [Steroidobacteraceae bacterium]|nr:HEAT repeat domain-containing protein [Steroidobacteraceae bacterium]
MSARASEARHFQHCGAARPPRRHLGAPIALIVLAAIVTPAFARPPRAAQVHARAAEALVAQLRDMPLPRRPLARAISSAESASRPLPALEVRRQRIYEELHALGPASVAALARALRDPDPRMRRDAAVALGVVGGGWWHFPDGGPKLDLRPALPALLAALEDPDPSVRAWAAQDVSDMGSAAATAVPRLRAMLHRPDAQSRGSASRALGYLGSAASAALPDLRGALEDSSPAVRRAASDAIARIHRAHALREPAPAGEERRRR